MKIQHPSVIFPLMKKQQFHLTALKLPGCVCNRFQIHFSVFYSSSQWHIKIKACVYGFSQWCGNVQRFTLGSFVWDTNSSFDPWPINAKNTASRDCAADEPYPLPFCRPSQRKWIFHIPSMQPQLKMHLFLWRVRTICVTKALTAQSIPLTQDPFFTVRWDNSQTASELTNVTA